MGYIGDVADSPTSNQVDKQPSREEIRAIAERIAQTPYDPVAEGDINIPAYDGCDFKAVLAQASINSTDSAKGSAQYKADSRKADARETFGNTALDFVGNTPMVKVDRLKKALIAAGKIEEEYEGAIELFAKCECYSSGGSVKDRIALRMIEEAERSGRIRPGDTLIEATSGNTGTGLSMAGAIKGYNVIITMPLKMSGEKVNTMKALGALIYRTPNEAAWNDTNSHIALAARMHKQIPRSCVLDQYNNPYNPLAHYDDTGREILQQLDGKLDYMMATAGTGGTVTGIAGRLKKDCAGVQVVGIDPEGSILAQPESLNEEGLKNTAGNGYQIEGIGYDFIPTALDRSLVDHWVKTEDKESFRLARTIVRREGILCGGSCGSCVAGTVVAMNQLGIKKGRVCMLLADSTRNYMSKWLDDKWMEEKGFPLDTY